MKKTIIGLAIAVPALWLGTSYLTGSIAESETRNLVAKINQESLDYGTAEISSYDRGIQSSSIRYSYSLPPSLAVMTGFKEKIEYQCEYDHGITGIDYACSFSDNPAFQALLNERFGGENPVKITGAISAFGGLTQKISILPIEQKMEAGGVFKLAASEVLVESDNTMSEYEINATVGVLSIVDAAGDFSAGPIKIDMDIEATDLGLYAGHYSMVSDKLLMKDQGEEVEIRNLEVERKTIDRNETMDSVVVLNAKSVSSSQSDDNRLEDLSLSFDFLGVNSQALKEYQAFMRTLQADLMANVEHGGKSEMDPNQMMAMLPIVEKMLDKGLNIRIAAGADLGGNPNSLDFQLELLDKMTVTQMSAFMFDPESVLKKFKLRLKTKIDSSILEGNIAAKQAIERSAVFKSDGDSYSLDIQLGENSSLNGESVTFQELQGLVLRSVL